MDEFRILSTSMTVCLTENFVDAEIDNEVVALNVTNGMCYGLSRVASRIWRLLSRPIRISDLCAALLIEYEIDPNDCEREVIEFLEELRAEGLITVRDEK